MTYKQIEQMRETRLWVTQIFVPAILIGGVIVTNPNVQRAFNDSCEKVKNKIKTFKK